MIWKTLNNFHLKIVLNIVQLSFQPNMKYSMSLFSSVFGKRLYWSVRHINVVIYLVNMIIFLFQRNNLRRENNNKSTAFTLPNSFQYVFKLTLRYVDWLIDLDRGNRNKPCRTNSLYVVCLWIVDQGFVFYCFLILVLVQIANPLL